MPIKKLNVTGESINDTVSQVGNKTFTDVMKGVTPADDADAASLATKEYADAHGGVATVISEEEPDANEYEIWVKPSDSGGSSGDEQPMITIRLFNPNNIPFWIVPKKIIYDPTSYIEYDIQYGGSSNGVFTTQVPAAFTDQNEELVIETWAVIDGHVWVLRAYISIFYEDYDPDDVIALWTLTTDIDDYEYCIEEASADDTKWSLYSKLYQAGLIKPSEGIDPEFQAAVEGHISDTDIHVTADEKSSWNNKQDALVSGTNIKTVGGNSILGSGDIPVLSGIVIRRGTITTKSGVGSISYSGFSSTPTVVATSYVYGSGLPTICSLKSVSSTGASVLTVAYSGTSGGSVGTTVNWIAIGT